MAGLLASDLDTYSRFALPLILVRFPEWDSFGVVQPRPDGAGGTVEFNVPCPNPAAQAGLWVSTADEELTVGFHTHHGHFTGYDTRLNPAQVEAALEYAAAIVGDRVGVVSYYRGAGSPGRGRSSCRARGRCPGCSTGWGRCRGWPARSAGATELPSDPGRGGSTGTNSRSNLHCTRPRRVADDKVLTHLRGG
jgi:hypothetical protein